MWGPIARLCGGVRPGSIPFDRQPAVGVAAFSEAARMEAVGAAWAVMGFVKSGAKTEGSASRLKPPPHIPRSTSQGRSPLPNSSPVQQGEGDGRRKGALFEYSVGPLPAFGPLPPAGGEGKAMA